jgi:hypothetical protein
MPKVTRAPGRFSPRLVFPRGPTSSRAPDQDASMRYRTNSLHRLPTEILEQIVSHIVHDTELGVMEGIGCMYLRLPGTQAIGYASGLSPGAQQICDERQDARSIALTCSCFPPIVERLLYKRICLPQAAVYSCRQYPTSALPYLVRTLIERPDLARRIQSLEVWVRDRRLVKNMQEPLGFVGNPYHECINMAWIHVAEIGHYQETLNWRNELLRYQELALHAVLITLLPRLQDLKLYGPVAKLGIFAYYDPLGRERQFEDTPDYSFLDVALRNSPITSVYMGVPFRTTQFPGATLTDIEVDVTFFMDRNDWVVADSQPTLPLVRSVSIVLNLAILHGIKLQKYCLELDVQNGIALFLHDIVINMTKFAITSPRGQLPFCPIEENRTDLWGFGLPLNVEFQDMVHDIEDNPLEIDWNGEVSWDWLLRPLSLRVVKNRLRQLKVPLNWYSGRGHTQPMGSLQDFLRIEVLELPRAAIIPNPHGVEYDDDDHELECSAENFLPKSIRRLVVSQVDIQTCAWVQSAFEHRDRLFPDWTEVVFHFRDDYVAVLSDGFRDAAKMAGVELVAHWRGRVETIVAR